jgi:hypothetical protein
MRVSSERSLAALKSLTWCVTVMVCARFSHDVVGAHPRWSWLWTLSKAFRRKPPKYGLCPRLLCCVCCRGDGWASLREFVQCLVIGEITTDNMVVVLNKVDQLPPDPVERSKALDKAKARISKALSTTRFADAPMVCVSALEAFEKRDTSDNPGNISELLSVMAANLTLPTRSSEGPFVLAVDHCFPIR